MDHAEAIEHIELAAAEPNGLDRLMAGDTPNGAAVAGHLAGCPACVAELARIEWTASVVREIVAAAPDPALRERTLAFVRAVGRDRSGGAPGVAASVGQAIPIPPAPLAAAGTTAPPAPTAGGRRPWLAIAAIAAVIVLAVGLGYGIASVNSPDPRLVDEVAVLEAATREAVVVGSQPDARHVALAATAAAPGATGTLVLSPSMGELVVVADGLPALGPGEGYGCWVEADGTRTRIGWMYPGGELQAWAGPVEGLGDLPADAVFGVSLVPAGGGAGEPMLIGG